MMNKYVRKLFGAMFQSQQTQQIVRIQPQRLPTSEEWRQHWQSQGQSWRTEPEIDEKRQEELTQRRAIVPDIEKGIYPFKGMKLSRADVEWLLATHENGKGPVNWSDENQRGREGLDLRGADLCGLDLSDLPLACLKGGLTRQEWSAVSEEWRKMAAIQLTGARLTKAQLQGTNLILAQLEKAYFMRASLEGATLQEAQLRGANFSLANLRGVDLYRAQLEEADFWSSRLEETSLIGAQVGGIDLREAVLWNSNHIGPSFADAQWGNTNLAVVNWSQIHMLGDEYQAFQKMYDGKIKSHAHRRKEFELAVRANRQLAIALENQGLSNDAAYFAYRACSLQRKVYWRQRKFWKWFGSATLALLAGYGYQMWRILVAYLFIISLCSVLYFALGMHYEPHLTLVEAVLTSITAFHGRVFSEPFLQPSEPQLWVTAFEAVAGLVIEGVFIAMLTTVCQLKCDTWPNSA